jgi:hypothetical protein
MSTRQERNGKKLTGKLHAPEAPGALAPRFSVGKAKS